MRKEETRPKKRKFTALISSHSILPNLLGLVMTVSHDFSYKIHCHASPHKKIERGRMLLTRRKP